MRGFVFTGQGASLTGMGTSGNRFRLGKGMKACPECDQFPELVSGPGGIRAHCATCQGLGQVAIAASPREADEEDLKPGERQRRMQMVHTLAWYLHERHRVFGWQQEATDDEGRPLGATRIRFTIEVDHVRFWKVWSEVAKRKGWKS